MAENYESVFLTSVQPKPGFGPFEVQPCVKCSEFGPRVTLNLYANGPECFPPGFFTRFGRSTAKNYESVFLTSLRPNDAFHRHATKIWVLSFWPSCDYFPIPVLLTNGATNGGLSKTNFLQAITFSPFFRTCLQLNSSKMWLVHTSHLLGCKGTNDRVPVYAFPHWATGLNRSCKFWQIQFCNFSCLFTPSDWET